MEGLVLISMSVHWSLENAHQAHVRTWMARSDASVLLDTSCRMTNVKTLMSVWNSQKFVPWGHAATLRAVSSACVQKALYCLPQEGDAKI